MSTESIGAYLAGLVLCDLVLSVLLAIPALAVGSTSLGNVDLSTRKHVSPLSFLHWSRLSNVPSLALNHLQQYAISSLCRLSSAVSLIAV